MALCCVLEQDTLFSSTGSTQETSFAKKVFLCFTSQSTIFQSCRDNFLSSGVEPVLKSGQSVLPKDIT